jgi:predicted TIM-barrel fold metal-dependent hydrolase
VSKSRPDEPLASPVPFRAGSNGEFAPPPASEADRQAEEAYRRLVEDNARRLGVSRRDFVTSACGTAGALLMINQAYGCGKNSGRSGGGGEPGGRYAVDETATLDAGAACAALRGDEFIFDVQTHQVELARDWMAQNPLAGALRHDARDRCKEAERLACWTAESFIREIFVKSDTTVACLSMLPAAAVAGRPLIDQEAAATRETVDRLARSPRLLIHGMVSPELGAAQLDDMQRMAEQSRVSAWKVYPQFGGWRLDDARVGVPFLERARALGVKIVCAHKGLSFPDVVGARKFASPADFGPAAKAFPDLTFLAYHSGFEHGITEGPYDAKGGGVDRLIRSAKDAGIGPGGNIHAELGSTWRTLMTRPTEAAHVLGKLLVHLGPDNVLWGTDSLWYGTPQGQIEAFRAFEIPTELQERHGYPALTRELKAKILGGNAARVYGVDPAATRCAIGEDDLARKKAEHDAAPERRMPPQGPRTRREFIALFRAHPGYPGNRARLKT